MSPTPSPDGKRFAFVAFRGGVPTLYTAPIAGGRPSAWREVKITTRRPVTPTGRVHLRVVGPDGKPMPARVYVDASDGRTYTPDGAFHRAMMVIDRHYFHTRGRRRARSARGTRDDRSHARLGIQAEVGHGRRRAGKTQTATITLERLVDLPARGWYSGDSHVHDLHQGFGLTHEAFFLQLVAEDIHLTNALIHMDGTRLMGRWSDLTGKPSPLSTPTHILQYAEEFRGGLGHIGMIGTHEFILPLVAGDNETAYGQPSLERIYFEGAHAQGGLAGFMHPYTSAPRTPTAAASTLIALDVALGLGDYYDIGALYSDELGSADFYYRLLNAGFHLPATGGTDQFSDVWRDPPPGSDRTFAHLDGPLTMQSLDGRDQARPDVHVDGPAAVSRRRRPPAGRRDRCRGERAAHAPRESRGDVDHADGLAPDHRQWRARSNGARRRDHAHIAFDGPIAVPKGGWVAARVIGPGSKYIGDDYAFAQTSPVYVVRGGHKYVRPEDVQFLAQTIDAIWARVERARWRSDAERNAFRVDVDSARAVYARIAAGADR